MTDLSKLLPVEIVYKETFHHMEMNLHYHNSYEIIYIVEGGVQFLINNKKYSAKNSNIIFINHFESHQLEVTSYPYKRYYILINPEYFQSIINEPILSSIFKHRPGHFRHVANLDGISHDKISGIIKEIYNECISKDDFWKVSVSAQIKMLFVCLYRNLKEHFPIKELNKSTNSILEIQRYIEEYYMDDINLKDIAAMFFMDMYYVSHLFKKVTGFTFKEYLIRQRISRAKDLLYHSHDNITQVAFSSGFNNVNHFIRIFKKIEGITPLQYRNSLKGR